MWKYLSYDIFGNYLPGERVVSTGGGVPWFLLNKQKKCVSLNEASKTLGICKKAIP